MAPTDEGNDPEPDSRLKYNTYGRIIFSMPKPSHRGRIVEAGLKVMFRKGYGGAGGRDLFARTPPPPGSFTNHLPPQEGIAPPVLPPFFFPPHPLPPHALASAHPPPPRRP